MRKIPRLTWIWSSKTKNNSEITTMSLETTVIFEIIDNLIFDKLRDIIRNRTEIFAFHNHREFLKGCLGMKCFWHEEQGAVDSPNFGIVPRWIQPLVWEKKRMSLQYVQHQSWKFYSSVRWSIPWTSFERCNKIIHMTFSLCLPACNTMRLFCALFIRKS